MSGSSPYQAGGAGMTKAVAGEPRYALTPGPSLLKGTTSAWTCVTPGGFVHVRVVPKAFRVASFKGPVRLGAGGGEGVGSAIDGDGLLRTTTSTASGTV